MKKIFLITIILSFVFVANGCSDDDNTNNIKNEKSVIGTWKHTERYDSPYTGGWHPVEGNVFYTFKIDGTLTISGDFQCVGNYNIQSDNLFIEIDCDDNQWKLVMGTAFNFTFDDNNYLVLTPSPMMCDEGCGEKLKRIN